MDSKTMAVWITVCAINARIEAMKTLNSSRADHGAAQAYGCEAFFQCETELEKLRDDYVKGKGGEEKINGMRPV